MGFRSTSTGHVRKRTPGPAEGTERSFQEELPPLSPDSGRAVAEAPAGEARRLRSVKPCLHLTHVPEEAPRPTGAAGSRTGPAGRPLT